MNKSGLTVLIVAGLLLASCNISNSASPQPSVMTAAALTVEAALTPPTTPLASATVNGPTATTAVTTAPASLTPTITATITPTYSVPMLTITGNTNCRTGPGEEYEIVFTFFAGAKAEIVGQYVQGQENYWIVKMPDSGGTCWAWGQYATVTGSSWVVPTIQPPPTKTPAPPEAPTGLRYDYFCTFNGINTDIQVDLRWTDRSDNEEGFRVLRDGEVVAQLLPNTTTYSEVHDTDATTKVAYTIEVFRGDMTARSGTIAFSCQ